MPDFTITLTPAQATRAAKAFGHLNLGSDLTQPAVWVNATPAEVKAKILEFVKGQVQAYEAAQAQQTTVAAVQAENWTG